MGADVGGFIKLGVLGVGGPCPYSIEEWRLLWFILRTEAAEGRLGEPGVGEAGVCWISGEVASMVDDRPADEAARGMC